MAGLPRITRAALLCAGFMISLGGGYATCAEALRDLKSHPTPNIPRPPYLEAIRDPTFGSVVIRVTDAGQNIINPTGDPTLEGLNWGNEAGHGYSSQASWNADESLLMIEKGVVGEAFLDGKSYVPLFQRVVPGRARWHPIIPDRMLYIDKENKCIGGYDVRVDEITWRRCLDGYESIEWSDPGKGKPSMDGLIVPIRAQRSSDGHWVAMLYYIGNQSLSDQIDMTAYVEEGDAPDFVMSPLGDVIIVVGCIKGHSGRCHSQVAIDVATQSELWRNLEYHAPGHADEFIDQTGEQWRVGVAKEGDFKGQIIKRHFRTGEVVPLIPYWGAHTSTRNIHDPSQMIVASYHNPRGPLQNEIVGVCPDGSCLDRYAHTYRFDDSRYLGESQASISPLGDRIVFRSSWGREDGAIDAYVIEIGNPMTRDGGKP